MILEKLKKKNLFQYQKWILHKYRKKRDTKTLVAVNIERNK